MKPYLLLLGLLVQPSLAATDGEERPALSWRRWRAAWAATVACLAVLLSPSLPPGRVVWAFECEGIDACAELLEEFEREHAEEWSGGEQDLRAYDFAVPSMGTDRFAPRLAEFFRAATEESVRPFLDVPELLQQAARYADADLVAFLIASGFDPNLGFGYGLEEYPQQGLGQTLREGPLHYAAKYNAAPSVVLALVQGGARVNAVGGGSLETPLHYAVLYNNEAVVRALLDAGADPSAANGRISQTWSRSPNINGNQPLHVLPCGGNLALVDVLVDAGADVAARNGSGLQPLHFAVLCRRPAAIAALVRRGADPNAVVTQVNDEDEIHDCTGCNGIGFLVNELVGRRTLEDEDLAGVREVLRVLVDAGADVNGDVEAHMYSGHSPLGLAVAARLGRAVAAMLIEFGARRDSEVLFAFFEQTFQYTGKYAGGFDYRSIGAANDLKVLDLLLQDGEGVVDVQVRDRCGATPLHLAASFPFRNYLKDGAMEKAVEKLLAAGADANARKDGSAPNAHYEWCQRLAYTPLHAAAARDEEGDPGYAMARMLLAAGADPNVPNPSGKTALDVAASDRMKALLGGAALQ